LICATVLLICAAFQKFLCSRLLPVDAAGVPKASSNGSASEQNQNDYYFKRHVFVPLEIALGRILPRSDEGGRLSLATEKSRRASPTFMVFHVFSRVRRLSG
jgi:hypothetical protein